MLKKTILTIWLLLLVLNIGACNKAENKVKILENAGTVKPTVENRAPTTATIVENIESRNKNDVDYKITKLNYLNSEDKLKYDINYPQISGLSDNNIQKSINSTLKDEAIKVLKYYDDPYGSVELSIDYEITLKNPSILSIQYSGVGSVSNAAHPNSLFFTTTINIKTGNRLRLKDIVNIDKNFANKFLNGEFKALHPEQSEVLKQMSVEEVQENFNEADSLDNIGTEKQSDVFSYFTNCSLGISVSVGHALGEHAEFEIDYQDLKDNINTKNEIWKDLLN